MVAFDIAVLSCVYGPLDARVTTAKSSKRTAQLPWLNGVSWRPDGTGAQQFGDWFALA
jgi:hypothetical protein